MEIATWIIAGTTIIYAIGTLLLWYTTRESIKQSVETHRLDILVALINLHKPVYGMQQESFNNYSEFIKGIEPLISCSLQKNYPEGHEKILTLLKQGGAK